ncbi:MAG: DMT family transporter [Chloroflexi bacterium]|nr:MAG: DMT family transporter [Chloroflexota bacterium]TME43749.1 MAG: DMT family transporter [Chloroflexota bacterium]
MAAKLTGRFLVSRLTPNTPTIAAFLAIVVLGGGNGVAVRVSNQQLAPLWGATLRFGLAAMLLVAVVAIRRIPFPSGAALTGSVLYGLLGFAGAFGLIYWSLVTTPAGIGQMILALVPLLTFLFAISQGLERFRLQGIAGALLALGGIATIFGNQLSGGASAIRLLALVGAAACMAASNVVVKAFPKCHPVANNAVGMALGSLVLFALSFVSGEPHILPPDRRTWIAVAYVSLAGAAGVFSLFLYVIRRWSASSTSYVMLLMPLVTLSLAAAISGEPIAPMVVFGGALVLIGVYLGAFASLSRRRPAARIVVRAVPLPNHPGCA